MQIIEVISLNRFCRSNNKPNVSGRVFVNIREYYEDANSGERRPGKKGIALSVDQWERLKEHMEDIDKAIKEKA